MPARYVEDVVASILGAMEAPWGQLELWEQCEDCGAFVHDAQKDCNCD